MTVSSFSTQKPCAICGTDENVSIYLTVFDPRTQQDEKMLRCGKCTLMYVDEPLRNNFSFAGDINATDFEKKWSKQFPDASDAYGDDAWGETYQNRTEVIDWQYATVTDFLGDTLELDGATVLEIGAARGYTLGQLKKHHPHLNLIGVEPSPIMAAHVSTSGARAVNGIVEDSNLEPATLDAAYGFGCFIQVRDPLPTLRYLNRGMKMGGKLMLDSPNSDSLFRLTLKALDNKRDALKAIGMHNSFESAYRLTFNPGRFYFYSPTTYAKLLELAGFTVKKVKMRQPRSVQYGTASKSFAVSAMMNAVSIAEKLTNRQSWVEIQATKIRELE